MKDDRIQAALRRRQPKITSAQLRTLEDLFIDLSLVTRPQRLGYIETTLGRKVPLDELTLPQASQVISRAIEQLQRGRTRSEDYEGQNPYDYGDE